MNGYPFQTARTSDLPRMDASGRGDEAAHLDVDEAEPKHLNGRNGQAHFPPVIRRQEQRPRNGGRQESGRRAESDRRFQTLFDHLPESVFVLDARGSDLLKPIVECNEPDGRSVWSLQWSIVECNQAACQRHGYLRDELLGQPVGIVGPLTDQPEVLGHLLKRLKAERVVRFQAFHRGKDGATFSVAVSCTRLLTGGRERVILMSREEKEGAQPETDIARLAAFAVMYPYPLLEINANGQVVHHNAAAKRLAQSLDQVSPAALLPLNAPARVTECLATRESLMNLESRFGGRIINWAFCPVTAEKRVFACAVEVTSWTQPAPEKNGTTVTERLPKRREDNWLETELVQSAADAIVSMDVRGLFLSFNPAAERLTGYTAREVIGQSFARIPWLESVSLAPWAATFDQIIAGNETKPMELTVVRKDQQRVTVEANSRAIRRQGKPAGIHLILRDVTDRKRVEQAVRKREASLVMAQKVGHTGSWEMDLASGAIEWSQETFRLFDMRPGEFVPTREAVYKLVYPASLDQVKQTHEQAIKKGEGYNMEYRIQQRDGSECWVFEQAEVMADSNGKPARLVATVQDITKRKQLEEQARHVEKWEAIGRLAGGVAHDFNNILTDIRRCTELIQASPKVNDDVAPQLKQLAVAAERATNLTWQLLALSRKQSAQSELVDMNKLINNVSDMFHQVLQPDIALELKLAKELPSIPAHSSMLEQVLVHLAINARYAMSRGGKLIIETRITDIDTAFMEQQPEAKPGRYVCLSVIDTDAGSTDVKSTRMACIHEPFFTTKNVGQGTGLGLATVNGIIKQHQGWIDVSTVLGKGTAFRVYLPVQPSRGDTLQLDRPHRPISGGSETILLVEGDPLLRALARSILQRYGYKIVDAGTGPEAIAAWEKLSNRISLLLTDLGIPGPMNARELAQHLQLKNPKINVLYTSGYTAGLTQPDFQLKPGFNFLPKPYSATALAQAVRNCLDHVMPSRDTKARPPADPCFKPTLRFT
ncbi:MAG: PAS domain S-box protein [Verrucomicrobiota bacterium]